MKKQGYEGEVVADIFEARFAYSGKVVGVRKKRGELVKKGEVIASLDRKVLQMELDRQLSDYEKVRADFELFRLKTGDGGDDVAKYLRQGRQAELNRSVKEVELAKYKLDQADLVSPVNGTIISNGGLATGLHITPASNPVEILDSESLRFQIEVTQENLFTFLQSSDVIVKLGGADKEYSGKANVPQFGKNGKFLIDIRFESTAGLLVGMKGEADIHSE